MMDTTLFYRVEGGGFNSVFTGLPEYQELLRTAPDTEFFPLDNEEVQAWALLREKASARATVAASAEKYRARISGDATQRKMASWPVWRQIALEIKAGKCDPQDKYAFQIEVKVRGKGETLDQFCDAVLRDARRYQVATALINGLESSTKAAIDKVTTPGGTGILLMNASAMAEAEFSKLLAGAV